MEKYQQLKELGRGAFGTVYLCRDIETNESYAIKEIIFKKIKEDDIQKVKAEVIVLKRINSYYVIKCYDSFIENLNLYIVLQYCSHETLRDLIEKQKQKQEPLNEDLIWEIFLKICLGVAAFHTKKIIHRDLKPENIFMFDNNTPKIGDTGVSKILPPEGTTNTITGTALYLSPEVTEHKPYNEKSDIWAVGVILYQLCTLQLPFSEILEIINKIPKKISNYSEDVQKLIDELLEKNPEKRLTLLQIFNKENTKKKLKKFNLFDEASKLYPELLNNGDTPDKSKIESMNRILEINKLFEKCPPLDDGTVVEIKEKVEFEDKSIYYGEWSMKGKIRHGRGIQIWEDGRKYEGYWKEDKQDIRGIESWSDGRIYEGEYKQGKRNGKGTIKWSDGEKYEGEWKDDKMEGQGFWISPNGRKYIGELKDGKREGQGIYTRSDGSKYVGEWKDDKPEGQGMKTWSNGDKYVGEWKDNKKVGQGIHTLTNGEKYVGEWKDDKREGQGIRTWSDKSKYIGELKNDKIEGQGIYTWPDGEKYVGEWKDHKREGQGIRTLPTGSKYFGEWKNNKIEGQGIYTWPDDEKHVGEWKNDKIEGQGIRIWSDGSKYVGEWKDNKKENQGILTTPDGSKYIGEWKDDKREGQGIRTWSDKSKYIGESKNDKIIGQGIYTWPDGEKYVGEWKDHKREGQGIRTLPTGSKYFGEWKNNKIVQDENKENKRER